MDETDPDAEIDYKAHMVHTEESKKIEDVWPINDEDSVYQQCLKFCYYIQKVRGFEVLQMKAEFFKDHNGEIWFFYCRDINVRRSKGSNATSSTDAKKQAK